MGVLIKELSETDFTMGEVHALIKEAYKEREQEGIHFWALSTTTEEIEKRINDNSGIVFVAIEENSKKLLGTGTVLLHKDNKGLKYAGLILAAVAPSAQGRGIGKLLRLRREEYAKKCGCIYISSSTAEHANSSIEYHLKTGSKKYSFVSSKNSNYYSIVFRKYINDTYNHSDLFYFVRFNLMKYYTKTLFHENGVPTLVGEYYTKIKKIKWI